LIQYSQDYDEVLIPISMTYDAGSTDGRPFQNSTAITPKWMDLAQPYIKSTQIFSCPSDGSTGKNYSPLAGGKTTWGSYAMNYCYPDELGASLPNRTPVSMISPGQNEHRVEKLSSLVVPATTIWVTDNANSTGTPPDYSAVTYVQSTMVAANDGSPYLDLPGYAKFVRARHLDTANVLYCDGHVKAQKIGYFLETAGGYFKNWTIQDE
jgi:prepilin-type processing-associated H-X9-DG protein